MLSYSDISQFVVNLELICNLLHRMVRPDVRFIVCYLDQAGSEASIAGEVMGSALPPQLGTR